MDLEKNLLIIVGEDMHVLPSYPLKGCKGTEYMLQKLKDAVESRREI
ncbi:hypothetical protein [Bacillus gaemokensis]|nr:hypothetical protein [Bacillus gaemokensis]